MVSDLETRLITLQELIVGLKEVAALQAVADLLHQGADPKLILDCLQKSVAEIGRLYQAREYYMVGLVLAGELLRQALSILLPHLTKNKEGGGQAGRVIVGTIEGDIHDLGKNMAGHFLEANGFEVIDLGVDVSPRTFLTETLKHGPDIVGVSLLLTTCVEPLKRLHHLFTEAYQDQPDAPLFFVGCGFLQAHGSDPGELKRRSRQWLGVEHCVITVDATVQLCLSHMAGLRTSH